MRQIGQILRLWQMPEHSQVSDAQIMGGTREVTCPPEAPKPPPCRGNKQRARTPGGEPTGKKVAASRQMILAVRGSDRARECFTLQTPHAAGSRPRPLGAQG